MKCPANIKDKTILAYIEWLESQISSEATKKKFYNGIQRQLDLIADELLSDDFKISIKNEGKEFDKFFDLLTKGTTIIQAMKNFENEVMPKIEEKKQSNPDTADAFLT